MTIILALFILIMMYNMKIAKKGSFASDYLSIEKTKPIKGIFTFLLFLSHATSYMSMDGIYDKHCHFALSLLGQMMVAMFLFYSGYGIMESIKRKGFSYVDGVLKKRLPKLLIKFDVAVLFYFIVQHFIFKVEFDSFVFWTSWIAYNSLGNPDWYNFVTFAFYIFIYISFYNLKRKEDSKHYISAIIFTLLTIIMVFALKYAGKKYWWYNTAIIFPLGLWYSLFKDRIDDFIMKNDKRYFSVVTIMVFACLFSGYFQGRLGFISYTAWGFAFSLFVVIATMKITFGNKILDFFGDHVFSIYVLQRLPMITLNNLGLAKSNRYLFFALTLLTTILLAVIFDKLFEMVFKRRSS